MIHIFLTGKRFILICGLLYLFFIFSGWALAAQKKPAQSSMEQLNLLAFGGVGLLKYQMGGEPGGEAVSVDDSAWPCTFPGFKWPNPNTNVWLRSTMTIPEKIGGFSLIGRRMTLRLYIDNGGDVFVNGTLLGSFEWGPAEFVLSERLQAGDRIVLAVRAINRPGWGKVSEFSVTFSGMEDFQARLQDKVWGLFIAQRVAQKLSDRPEHWLAEIDKTAGRLMACKELQSGDEQGFLAAFDRESAGLSALQQEVKKKYQLYCAGYSHMDLAWMWPWEESVEMVRNTTQSVFNIMERFPDFKYSMGQAHAYEWLEERDPKLFAQIREKIQQGRWEVVGGQWVEPDGNLPSGESFVRQSLYGKRYFRKKFGVEVKIGWLPDSFGFNWNLPQILSRSGYTGFVVTRVDLNDSRDFPHRLFWWQGPDGSKLATYVMRDGYMHDLTGEQLVDFIAEEKKELNIGKELVLYGVGDHGGGPTMAMLERALRAQTAPAFPEMNLAYAEDFFNALTDQDRAKLQTWSSELYLESMRGCYTSQARTKKHNRQGEVLIQTAEKASALASLYDYDYPQENLFSVWRTVLFNQFHDILPGTSINSVYQRNEKEYAQSNQLSRLLTQRALESLAQHIDTRGPGEALVIFNPLSWSRTSPAAVELNDLEKDKSWSILDELGNAVATQVIERTPLGAKLLFIAREVPSLGYKTYRLVAKQSQPSPSQLAFTRTDMENRFLRVTLDPATGLLSEIFDRSLQRAVLSEPKGNLLQVLIDDAHDAWNMNYSQPPVDLNRPREISLMEYGPVRVTIKVVQAYQGKKREEPTPDFPTSFFTQYISLYDGLPYVEVRNEASWWEEHKVLKVGFPLNVHAPQARYEIPYGSITRPTGSTTRFEKARFEVPAQRWADLSADGYGISLINDCKHGYDVKGNVLRLTLLRSSTYPDPTADKGFHEYSYILYPHAGDFYQAGVVQKSYEYNEPLQVLRTPAHKGELNRNHSFITVESDHVILHVVKKAEEGEGWILRFYETAGKEGMAAVRIDRSIKRVEEVNLIEDPLQSISSTRDAFDYQIKPNEIRTFRVEWR
ncbi:hypothetical protein GX408_11755 [bacterium]|nr:hypothetical protein [bacterium]